MPDRHSEVDLQKLDQLRQSHLGRLLLRTYRAFSSGAVEKLEQRGYTGISLTSTTLLMNIDAKGSQLTRLSEKIGISRQAVTNLVHQLESKNYLHTSPDPADRRAMVVTLTPKGWQLINDIVEVKAEIEGEFCTIIGNDQMQNLKESLTKLLQNVDNH